MEKQEKTLYNMDSTQLGFIQELAYKCPPDKASFSAQSVLYLLFGEEVPECEEMTTRSSKQIVKDVVFVLPEDDAYIEDNFPDPFIDKTIINYYLPDDMKGKVIVYDMFGRVVGEYILETGEKALTISSVALVPGVYTYSFVVNNKLVDVKKMIITFHSHNSSLRGKCKDFILVLSSFLLKESIFLSEQGEFHPLFRTPGLPRST